MSSPSQPGTLAGPPRPDPSHLQLNDVRVQYGTTVAVADLNVELSPGRIHGLLGRNGSGKTSLLSTVAGFRRPSAGEILLNGEPTFENPRAMSQMCLIRGHADSVQHNWPSDRVRDALSLAADLRPWWDAAYAADLVERFGLPMDQRLGDLSTGQRSAVGVVLGLACRAPLTMFDESYLGMDAPSRYAFYDALLEDFAAHPRTIVISTHLIEEVASLFEEVVIIDRGRLLLQDDAEALRSRGTTLVGPADRLDPILDQATVLASRQLGPTKAVTVYGGNVAELRSYADTAGIEVAPAGLQDLFVHLTSNTQDDVEPDAKGFASRPEGGPA